MNNQTKIIRRAFKLSLLLLLAEGEGFKPLDLDDSIAESVGFSP
jgi:hypothetical protein